MLNEQINPLKKIVLISNIFLWSTALSCLYIIIYIGISNNDIFSHVFKKITINNNNNQDNVENLMLKSGEVVFENKKAFVINTFRYQGVEEKLPFEINIRKEPQKLYDYIFKKKNTPQLPKTESEDFTIKPIPKQ